MMWSAPAFRCWVTPGGDGLGVAPDHQVIDDLVAEVGDLAC